MSGIRGFFIYPLTLAAGASDVINCQGTFFNVLECDLPNVLLGTDEGRLNLVEQGYQWFAPDGEIYTRVYVENPDLVNPVTLRLALGFGDLRDSQTSIAGGVSMSPASSFTYDGAVLVGDVAALIVPASSTRRGGVIQAGDFDLWLGADGTVAAAGLPTVPAGQSLAISHGAEVYAIRAAGVSDNAGVYLEEN